MGLGLWLASVLVTGFTGNLNMVPTVVLLGSFLVPVTAVVWYLDHYQSLELTPRIVLYAFILGGVIGVLAASLLESLLLVDGPLVYLSVGLIEEFAKLLALVLVAWPMGRYGVRDGIVLGAAVGFGFAALESSGYALNALIVRQGPSVVLSLTSLVFTELLRGILAPVGHGLWTGILGGVLFGAARGARLHLSRGLILAYLGVALLHALYDSMRGIAAFLAALVTAGRVLTVELAQGRMMRPSGQSQVVTFVSAEIAGLALVSVVGFVWLSRIWRRAPAVPAPVSADPRPG